MLFPDEALFEFVLIDLADCLAERPAPPITPLPCDRYVARSCLQKAIRRSEPVLAQRALANLFEHDRRATWRHLTIICVEDVGVANVDLLAQIIAAQRNRKWREQTGGDWPVMAELVRQMALSQHCQAACDLLLKACNDPNLEPVRAAALDASADRLTPPLWDADANILRRGVAALALAGELPAGRVHHDPHAVFDILADASRSSHVVATCRAAWKISRNSMALLLPLVWERWMKIEGAHAIADDPLPPVQMIGAVPGYALDQFTRLGNNVSRALLRDAPDLRALFERAGLAPAAYSRAVGDLLFLLEGSCCRHRAVWPLGEELRRPYRPLPTVSILGSLTNEALRLVDAKASQIAKLRHGQLHASEPGSRL